MILVTLGYNMYLLFCHSRDGFAWHFMKTSFLKVVALMFLTLLILYPISSLLEPSLYRLVLTGSLSTIIVTTEILFLVFDSEERNNLFLYINKKLHRNYRV